MSNILTKRIGWIGLGAMGKRMSEHLIHAGYNLRVFNRTKSKEAPLIKLGAESADSPAELSDNCDIIILMVSDDEAVKNIFEQEGGLNDAQAGNKVIINMSTVSPQISEETAVRCKENGNAYMDAPVSGSIKQAEDAVLVIMTGGPEKLHHEMKPLLELLGKKVYHTGDVGNGNRTKLAVNTFLAATTQALAETVLFADQMGIKPEDYLNVIGSGGLSSPYTDAKTKSILKGNFPSAFALKHMAKDLRLAKANNLNSPFGKVLYDTFNNAEKEYGDKDVMAVFKYLDKHNS